jgi:Protein of unknown function (DUF2690)
MRKLRLALLALPAVLALAFAATLAAAGPASAGVVHPAAGCFGNGCNGLDPSANGCGADAITADSVTVGGITVQLRWSAACGANWARIMPAPQGLQFRVENSQGHSWTETVDFANSSWFGNMVNGSGVTDRACLLPIQPGGCTNWH